MPEEVRCTRCGKAFENEDRVACISGRIMGDEYTDIYYWCGTCAVYTVCLCRDVFCGPETARDSGPISREEGDRSVAIIRGCSQPGDERCRCDAHLAYFGDRLD